MPGAKLPALSLQAFPRISTELQVHAELWLWTLLVFPLFSRKHMKRLWAGNKHFLPLKFHNPSSSGSVVSLRTPLCTLRLSVSPTPALRHLRRVVGWEEPRLAVQSPQFQKAPLLGDSGQPLSSCSPWLVSSSVK